MPENWQTSDNTTDAPNTPYFMCHAGTPELDIIPHI